MLSVNIGEARDKLSQLLAQVQEGETVRICRDGVPIAELRALPRLINPLESGLPPLCTIRDRAGLQQSLESDVEWSGKAWGL